MRSAEIREKMRYISVRMLGKVGRREFLGMMGHARSSKRVNEADMIE